MYKSLTVSILSSVIAMGAAFATTAQADEYSEATLKKFSQAEETVDTLRVEYLKKAFYAADAEKAVVAKEGEAKMAKAVQATGLNVSQYNAIAEEVRENDELRQRIASIH